MVRGVETAAWFPIPVAELLRACTARVVDLICEEAADTEVHRPETRDLAAAFGWLDFANIRLVSWKCDTSSDAHDCVPSYEGTNVAGSKG